LVLEDWKYEQEYLMYVRVSPLWCRYIQQINLKENKYITFVLYFLLNLFFFLFMISQ
jgi:hypothetical protein